MRESCVERRISMTSPGLLKIRYQGEPSDSGLAARAQSALSTAPNLADICGVSR